VGAGGTTVYDQFSYVGMIGILPTFQRHGIGKAIMEHILTWLQRRGNRTVLLDASDAGKPLYENMGFISDDRVSEFSYNPTHLPSYRLPHHPCIIMIMWHQ